MSSSSSSSWLPSLVTRVKENNYFLLELYIFLRAVGQSVGSISLSLLIQDKICLDRYNETRDFCAHINDPMKSAIDQNTKNHILAESTQFGNYKNFLECIPMVLWSLFIGSFLDNYSGGTRLVLLFGVFGDLFAMSTYVVNVYFYNTSKLSFPPFFCMQCNAFCLCQVCITC